MQHHMASRGVNVGLVIVTVAIVWERAMAQSGCTSVLISLAPCINYVTGRSPSPSASCCSQLASVVKSQPQCLCTVLNGGASSLGITVNQTLALALPGACNVKTPPVSDCKAVNGPAISPPGFPVGSPEGSPGDSSNTPTGSSTTTEGSTIVPETGGSSSNGLNINMPLQLVLFVLFMAPCATTLSSF